MAEIVGQIEYQVTLDTGKMIGETRTVNREFETLRTKFTAVASAVSVLAAAMAAVRFAKLADDARMLAARIDVAAGSAEAGARAMGELEAISRRVGVSVAASAEVFGRLNQAILQMGGTQQDTLMMTETLAKAIRVSGASAIEAQSAMLQFGQAMGSGKLAGDELKSLMEASPYLMRQLAESIGVPVGALKQLGEDGKLTSDVVATALSNAAAQIERDFATFPQTLGSAMDVMSDAAARANAKLDELTGTSAALTGATKGLGQVLDELAKQFGAANEQAGAMGRNEAIKGWANTTRLVLSYVVDAADLTWQTLSVLGRNVAFVFQSVGAEIGGIGAQVMAVMRGDFAGAKAIGEAMKADADKRRAELDAADAKALGRAKLAGQAMRDAWEQGAGGGRGSINPTAAPSRLKPTVAVADKKGDSKAAKRDADRAERDRMARERAIQADADRFNSDQQVAIEFAAGIIGEQADPADQIRARYEARKVALDEAMANELLTEQLHSQAVLANQQGLNAELARLDEERRNAKQAADQAALASGADLFGSLATITKQFAGEQSKTFKLMFAASKAFAIAESIVKIQQGIANAAALPFPANIGAMATVAASTASIISTIKGANYGGGRQYGGPVSADSLYRVNETGRPEMFTASNGTQYMMPTANGRVTSADKVGGGAVLHVQVINNHSGAQVQTSMDSSGQVATIVINQITTQIRENSGPLWNALRSSTNVQGRL